MKSSFEACTARKRLNSGLLPRGKVGCSSSTKTLEWHSAGLERPCAACTWVPFAPNDPIADGWQGLVAAALAAKLSGSKRLRHQSRLSRAQQAAQRNKHEQPVVNMLLTTSGFLFKAQRRPQRPGTLFSKASCFRWIRGEAFASELLLAVKLCMDASQQFRLSKKPFIPLRRKDGGDKSLGAFRLA